jgi:hypothetical protein
MKKMLLVLAISVLGLTTVYGQDYYIQVTEAQKGDKFEPVGGEVFLYDNQFAGVNFKMIPNLGYEERIANSKSGYTKREGYFLFKEGKGMKTDFIYQIGVNISEEKPPVEGLKWVIVDVYMSSYTGSTKLKLKGLMQQMGL